MSAWAVALLVAGIGFSLLQLLLALAPLSAQICLRVRLGRGARVSRGKEAGPTRTPSPAGPHAAVPTVAFADLPAAAPTGPPVGLPIGAAAFGPTSLPAVVPADAPASLPIGRPAILPALGAAAWQLQVRYAGLWLVSSGGLAVYGWSWRLRLDLRAGIGPWRVLGVRRPVRGSGPPPAMLRPTQPALPPAVPGAEAPATPRTVARPMPRWPRTVPRPTPRTLGRALGHPTG